MQQSTASLQNCKNCGQEFAGKFCNNCGEKVYTVHDKSILHFTEEGLHFITHFEGSFFRTLKAIFVTPGKLSADYTNGVRKKYFKPLSFFLLLVVLYLLFPLLSGLNMPMTYHLHQFPYSAMAQNWVQHFLDKHPTFTIKQVEDMFAAKSEKTSKLLLFVIIPLVALPLWLLFKKQRPYYFDSLIFSTEFNSFFLIIQFFIVPLLITMYNLIASLLNLPFYRGELVLSIMEIIMLIWFLQVALKRFVVIKKGKLIVTSVIVLVWQTISVYIIYKFLLFVFVFIQMH